MSRYDSRTTMFSPEGRLKQVEYAIETISKSGVTVGIKVDDGVVLVAEKKISSKLLDTHAVGVRREKMHRIDDHIVCAIAGLTADASVLIEYCRLSAQRYMSTYQEPMPCEQLVRTLCDVKQQYTQYGGKRPFGVSFLYAGWDTQHGFQLYLSDPSGNFGGWKATAAGGNHQAAVNILKTDYKEECNLQDAIELILRVMAKTMDTALSVDKIELATLTRNSETGKISYDIYEPGQLEPLLASANEQKEAKATAS